MHPTISEEINAAIGQMNLTEGKQHKAKLLSSMCRGAALITLIKKILTGMPSGLPSFGFRSSQVDTNINHHTHCLIFKGKNIASFEQSDGVFILHQEHY